VSVGLSGSKGSRSREAGVGREQSLVGGHQSFMVIRGALRGWVLEEVLVEAFLRSWLGGGSF